MTHYYFVLGRILEPKPDEGELGGKVDVSFSDIGRKLGLCYPDQVGLRVQLDESIKRVHEVGGLV